MNKEHACYEIMRLARTGQKASVAAVVDGKYVVTATADSFTEAEQALVDKLAKR